MTTTDEPVAEAPEAPPDEPGLPLEQTADVIHNFWGNVDAGAAQFGPSYGRTSRAGTGRIEPAQIESELDGYLAPDGFAEAANVLRERRVVVPTGEEGIGKRVSALALLREAGRTERGVTSLSPSLSLAELTTQKFRADVGYLVQDWVNHGGASAVQRFDLDRLAKKLEAADAYLVITVNRAKQTARREHDAHVPWQAPDPVRLFDHVRGDVTDGLSAAEVAEVRQRVAELTRPRDVRELVRRLRDGFEAAFTSIGDAAREQVEEWFDAEPDRREVLAVAALAFAHGLPEMHFEALLSRLVAIANGDRLPAEPPTAFPQRGKGKAGLDTVTWEPSPGSPGSGRERRRVFVAPACRAAVIEALVERYGFELWQPLRTWIDELAGSATLETRFELAVGLALYARHAPEDAERVFLDSWSDGTAPERQTAEMVLSLLCLDGRMTSEALRITLSWIDNQGTRRAVTAAQALGGELGLHFPLEALSTLWHLVLRNLAVSEVAARSLAVLFYNAVRERTRVHSVLRYLVLALGDLDRPERDAPRTGIRPTRRQQKAKALNAALGLLTTRAENGELLTTALLRDCSDDIGVLAELWALVLRNRPHRRAALDALRDTLTDLDTDPSGLEPAARLGAALRAALPSEEVPLLENDLRVLVSTPSPPGVSALLGALENTVNRSEKP